MSLYIVLTAFNNSAQSFSSKQEEQIMFLEHRCIDGVNAMLNYVSAIPESEVTTTIGPPRKGN